MKSPFAHGLTSFNFADQNDAKRGELNPAIKRLIKRKEDYLDKTCRRIFVQTNHLGEAFLFSRFSKRGNRQDNVMVTLASYIPHVGWVSAK